MKESQSTWQEKVKKKSFPKLQKDVNADVLVIGGGLCGILCAYVLVQSGRKVVLIEKEEIGAKVTAHTTAFLTHVIDTSVTDLISMFGSKNAKKIWQSHADAIDHLEEIIEKNKIDCEFQRCPAYIYANEEKQFEAIAEDHKNAKHFDFNCFIKGSNFLPFENYGCWQVNNQGKFHPLKFLYRLAEIIKEKGGQIYENTEALDISGKENIVVKTAEGSIQAKDVVIATYKPFKNNLQTFMKKGMYTSYMFEATIPKGKFEDAIYWDYNNPYHYFRVDSNRMVMGGEDHRKELKINKEKNYKSLEEHLDKVNSGKYKIVKKWHSYVLEPSDGLALMGQTKPHQYIASAFSGNGMTYSMIAADLLTDLIINGGNKYAEIYDPKRIPNLKQLAKKGADYVQEFFGGAVKNVLRK